VSQLGVLALIDDRVLAAKGGDVSSEYTYANADHVRFVTDMEVPASTCVIIGAASSGEGRQSS
jgi:hypothetical protein